MPHTPGPWMTKRAAVQTDGAYDFAVVTETTDIIAETFGRSGVATYHDAEANARLIAAAPELLAALKAAREFGLDDFKSGEQPIYEQMDAAIAKAEGREP